MIDITNIHVHYRDYAGKPHVKIIKPSNATNQLAIKKDIADYVTKIRDKAEYYYVVIEIDRGGKPAYRTVIPKTLLGGN